MADSARSPGQPSNKHCNGQGSNKDFTSSGRCAKGVTLRSKSSMSTFNKMSSCDREKEVTSPPSSHSPLSSSSLIMKLVKERDQLVLQAVNLYLQSNPNQSNLSDLFSPSISTTNSSRDISNSSPVLGIDESVSSSPSVLPVASSVTSSQTSPNVTFSPSTVQLTDGEKQTLPDSVLTSSSSKSSFSSSTLTDATCSTSLTTQQPQPHSPICTLTSDSVLLNEDQVRQRIEELKMELEVNDEEILAATACVTSMSDNHFPCSNCISSLADREGDAELIHELKGKIRNLQVENEEKNELISELRELLERNNENLTKIQQENSDLQSQTRRCKVLEDEIDILNEKVRLVDRLETEVLKYREKLNELDFYKTRLDEIREENKLLHDSKMILQDQLETFRCKSDKIPDLEAQIMRLTALNNDLNEKQSINKEKISCLMDELNSCRIEKKTIVDDLAQVQTELTHLRCLLNKNTNGSNLREQLNSDATKRLLKLELEHQKLLSNVDCIRNSELINTSATSNAAANTAASSAVASTSGDIKSSSSHGVTNVKAVSPTASSCSSSASSYQFSSSSSACSNKRYSIDCTNGPMVNVKHYLSTNGSTVDSLDDIDDADHLHNNFTPETLLYETDSGCVSLVGELNHRLEKIERENYQIKLSMDTIKESEGKLTKLRDENYTLQSQVTSLKGQLELSKMKLDSSEVNIANIKDDNQKLNKRINELSDEIDKLRKDKNILQKEKEKLEDNLKLTQDKLLTFSRTALQMRNNNLTNSGKAVDSASESESINEKNASNLPKSLNGIFNSINLTPSRSSAVSVDKTPGVLSSNFNRGTFKSSSVNFARVTTRDNSPRLITAAQRATLFPQSHQQSQQQQQQQQQYCHPNQTIILNHHHQYISNSITASTSITNSSPCPLSSNVINGSNIFFGSTRSNGGGVSNSNSSSNNVIDAQHQQQQLPQYHRYYQHPRSNSNIVLSGNGGGQVVVNNASCPGDASSTLSVSSSSPHTAANNHVHGHFIRVYHATHTTIGNTGAANTASSPSCANLNGTPTNSTAYHRQLSAPSSTPTGGAISAKSINVSGHQNSGKLNSISSSGRDDLLSLNSMTPSTKVSSTDAAAAVASSSKIAVQNATSNKNNMNNVSSVNSTTGNNVISSFISSPSTTASGSTCSSLSNHQKLQQHPPPPQQHSLLINSIHGKHVAMMSPHCHGMNGHPQSPLDDQQLVHHNHLANSPLNHHSHPARSVSPNTSEWFEYGCV